MYKTLLIYTLAGVLLSGCQFIRSVEDINIDQKCALVKSMTTTSTTIFLLTMFNDDKEKMNQYALETKEYAQKALSFLRNTEPSEVSENVLDIFNIPLQHASVLQLALDVFNTYFIVGKPEEIVGEDNLKLVIAFGEGVVKGCEIVLRGE